MIISNLKRDGYGAQLLAKITTYIFCRYYDISYGYTPIKKCYHTNYNDLDILFYINNKYTCDKNNNNFINIIESNCKKLDLEKLKNKHNNYNIATCHWFINLNPDIYYNNLYITELRTMYYNTPKQHSTLFNLNKKNKKILAIHIRRNDINKIKHPSRYINIDKYEKFIKNILNILNNIYILIYTDSRDDECNILERKNVKVNKCNLKETFHDFMESDILLPSISSLSYIPAILNNSAKIYYFKNYMYNGLKNWNILK